MQVPEKEVNEAANAVAEALDAMVFVYSGSVDPAGYGGLIMSMEPSAEQPMRPNAILFLTTSGGEADQAYRIARLMQQIANEFLLCVPSTCKSAGTLIALGASKIYMPIVSELGPIDVQLRRRDEIGQRQSGMVVRTALDGLADETFKVFEKAMLKITVGSGQSISFDVASRVASTIATGVMAPVYAQIDPQSLGNDLRNLSVATEYGSRLVEYGGNATMETVNELVEGYPAHEFIIDHEEAKRLFRVVEPPTEERTNLITALGKTIYEVQMPSRILRADGNFVQFVQEEEAPDDEDGKDSQRDASVDQRRKATRPGNRAREQEAQEPT